jgi:hypothetical protein
LESNVAGEAGAGEAASEPALVLGVAGDGAWLFVAQPASSARQSPKRKCLMFIVYAC